MTNFATIKLDMDKDQRIKKEINRLKKIYKEVFESNKGTNNSVIIGLIERAAYMRIILEDMEADLIENGFTEMFTQSEKTPAYERERPIARLYNTMNKNYQTIIKQLADMTPKPDLKRKDEKSDGFDEFVYGRGDN